MGESIIDGYWIRLTNGKKYKATSIPTVLKKIFLANEEDEIGEGDLGLENSLQLH